MRLLTALLLMFFAASAMAASYQGQGIRMAIPAGYEGPIAMSSTPGGESAAFTKKYPDNVHSSLLQISSLIDSRLSAIPGNMLQTADDTYLKQFLDGIGRRRTQFVIVGQKPVMLAGIKASRAEWTGQAQGQSMSGVMYCVIIGTRILIFHTQDFNDAPPSTRAAAIGAIESVQPDRGG